MQGAYGQLQHQTQQDTDEHKHLQLSACDASQDTASSPEKDEDIDGMMAKRTMKKEARAKQEREDGGSDKDGGRRGRKGKESFPDINN